MAAHMRTLILGLAVVGSVLIATPATLAVELEAPVTTIVDEYPTGADLSPYIFDRFNNGTNPSYEPLLETGVVDGRSVGLFTVDGAGPTAGYYSYQGFKRTTDGTSAGTYTNGFGTCLETTFQLDADFATSDRIVSFWPVTDTTAGGSNRWPVAGVTGYADTDTADTLSFWVFPGTSSQPGGWNHEPLPATFDYSAWHTLTYVLTPSSNVWYLDGEIVWSDPGSFQGDQTTIEHQIFNAKNFGETYTTAVDSFRVGGCTQLQDETARPGAMGGWIPVVNNTAVGGFTEDFGGATGIGAWQLDTGSGDGAGQGGKAWLYTDDLTGKRLAELTQLTYSTFVDGGSGAAAHLAPAINLQIDWDNDGIRDSALIWEPVYVAADQGAVTSDVWQRWDALEDGWWYNNSFGTLTSPAGEYQPIGYYLTHYPEATIVNWAGQTPGFAFVTGQSSGGAWADFVGAVDKFTYGLANGDLTTVDFEAPRITPSAASRTIPSPSVDTSVDVAVSLSGANGSLAGPAYASYTGVDVVFDWELKNGGTIIDSGSATISGGTTTINVPVTVPSDQMPTSGTYDFVFSIVGTHNAEVGVPPTSVVSVTVEPPIDPDPTGPIVTRLAGADRYGTAVAVAKDRFPGQQPIVFIATGENHPDALVAAAPAGTRGAPVLLVTRDRIPTSVSRELLALDPSRIYVIGGTNAISASVAIKLGIFAPVQRISGPDRYSTAAEIARVLYPDPGTVDTVFIATGVNHPDALVAAAPAGRDGSPILLVPRDSVPSSVTAQLQRLKPKRIYIVGGTAAVSSGVESTLAEYAPVTRLGGANRFETAQRVAATMFPGNGPIDSLFVATAWKFPDALIAAAPAGRDGVPVLITDTGSLSAGTDATIRRLRPGVVYVVGGPAAVSDATLNSIDWD
ncbi:MAG: cell wall-binding repeat-containing protein [Actinomycetia bacterium]|nr:cell wall-binding repeat-containing protein [Actinomycetes bacterium]